MGRLQDPIDRHQCPSTVHVAVVFIVLGALMWLALGILLVTSTHPAVPDSTVARAMGVVAVLLAGMLAVCAMLLRRRNRWAYWVVCTLLLVIAFSILLDEFGVVDFVVLVITMAPIALLWRGRRWFSKRAPAVDVTPRPVE